MTSSTAAPEDAAPATAGAGRPTRAEAPATTTAALSATVAGLAEHCDEWLPRVRLSPQGRWYERLHRDDDHEIWLISWLPGQSTGLHDHGGSRGAFALALGTLEERDLGDARHLSAGDSRAFGAEYVHEVRNVSAAPAISVHAYSPPLATMNRYDLVDGRLVRLVTEEAGQW
ncbi:cysteine dioxygenase family protein [Actinomadura sp. LOL_016]|uniref:cysteine dioxygenase n=1 Tax=unclassified Actinomadura TaxID=2626254 RepID=UPI003A80FC5F